MIARFAGLFGGLSRAWADRREYTRTTDWLVTLYDRLLRRWPRLPLPGRRRVARLRLANDGHPLYARLGTSDLLVLKEIFSLGEYDPLFEYPLGKVRTVVDLGANCGYSVRLWLVRFPDANVVAVEPDADNVAMLRRNNSNVPASRLTVVQACVGGGEPVYFDRRQAEWAYTASAEPVSGAEQMPTKTLPDILAAAGIDGSIDLLKCDIEGSERTLFADPGGWLHRVRWLLIELHPPYTPVEFLAAIQTADPRFEAWPFRSKGENAVFLLTRRSP